MPKSWYLIFYDVKGSKAFAKSTLRSKISRELARTNVLPLQQSVWALEVNAENKAVADRIVATLKAHNAKVLLFTGTPENPSTEEDVREMIGSLIDKRYDALKLQILDLKELVKKTADRQSRKSEFSRAALRLRRKFDRLVAMDPREMISNNRNLTEGEFFDLEKEVNETT